MSSYSKNRSANKGMCAQCCRLKYDLLDENHTKIKTDTEYLLSPKDMFLLSEIPQLIDAGVSCFKIEGRMKSSAYVGKVTSIYRKAIDAHLKNEEYIISQEDIKELKVLFNRNFTNGLLMNRNDLFGQKTPNHQGIEIGQVLYNKNNKTFIKLSDTLNQFDGIRINDFGCIVNMMYKNDLLVNGGIKDDVISLETNKKLSGKVYKTLDYQLEKRINNSLDKKIPIDVSIYIKPDENVKIIISYNDNQFVYDSDIVAQKAIKAPLDQSSIIKQFSKLNENVYSLNKIVIDTSDSFLPVKTLNQIRRDAISAFDEYRLNSFKRNTRTEDIQYNDLYDEDHNCDMIQDDGIIIVNDKKFYIDGVINTESKYSDKEYKTVSEFGGLLQNRHKLAYYTLNCCNSYAYELLKRLGFDYIVLSSELKSNEIDALIYAYENRLHKQIKPFVLGQGRRVLMYIRHNPFEKYISDDKKYYIDDGNNIYEIKSTPSHIELLEPENTDFKPNNNKYLQLIIKQ